MRNHVFEYLLRLLELSATANLTYCSSSSSDSSKSSHSLLTPFPFLARPIESPFPQTICLASPFPIDCLFSKLFSRLPSSARGFGRSVSDVNSTFCCFVKDILKAVFTCKGTRNLLCTLLDVKVLLYFFTRSQRLNPAHFVLLACHRHKTKFTHKWMSVNCILLTIFLPPLIDVPQEAASCAQVSTSGLEHSEA